MSEIPGFKPEDLEKDIEKKEFTPKEERMADEIIAVVEKSLDENEGRASRVDMEGLINRLLKLVLDKLRKRK